MAFPSGWELVLVLLVILVLFGAKRLPDSARALGRSMRILKAETKGLRDDDAPRREGETTVTAEQLPPSPPAQPYAAPPQAAPQAAPQPPYGEAPGGTSQPPRP